MKYFDFKETAKSPRIDLLKEALFAKKPEIEADRAVLLTESYKATENLPMIERRAKALKHILENIPITSSLSAVQQRFPEGARHFPNFLTNGLKTNLKPLPQGVLTRSIFLRKQRQN